jgi:hypothetical protein
MRGSYQTGAGLPSPLLIGGAALLIGASLFGGAERGYVLPGAGPEAVALESVDRMLAPTPPLQEALPREARTPIDLGGGHAATPSHLFVVDGVVLSRHPYRHGREAAVSPLDLVLGWGPMSNPAVLSHVAVSQAGRFGHVRAGPDAPVDLRALGDSWTNVHLVPADAGVARALEGIAEGQVVRLAGALVDVSGPAGFGWRTSTTRSDRGNGACEILLVKEVTVLR